MRVITVKQPWAWAIVHGGKDVENRVRNLAGDYRGPLAIHAGLAFDRYVDDNDAAWEIRRAITAEEQGYPADDGQVWASECIEEDDPRYAARGAIIGVVNLWAVHQDRDGGNCCPRRPVGGPGGSRWRQRDVWHLCLNDPQPLPEPIPFRGALGMRTLPAEVVEQIRRQVPAGVIL
ncbi:hypothetical protein [Cryobacterium soli]|uniref:hypothetical protein n=1 Tax=Cryobacterium soli TaxID=2220095 RepID=UPI000E7333DD|nr:hypothetical protein [Cryobacterium soli]